MNKIFILMLVFFISEKGFSQIKISEEQKNKNEFFQETFIDALDFADMGLYENALKLFVKLDALYPNNDNLLYNIGVCYIRSDFDKTKAIPYLEKAIKNTSVHYKGLWSDSTAALDTYFFLGKAYAYNMQFDKAISSFNQYKILLNKEHYSRFFNGETKAEILSETDKQLTFCYNAKRFISNPLDVKIDNVGSLINGIYNDYTPVLSADEKVIYFTSDRNGCIKDASSKNDQCLADIYLSEYNADLKKWDSIKKIGQPLNTAGYDECVHLSHDGKYMIIHREKSDDKNIYISEFKDNQWSVPASPSGDINLKSSETSACLSADNNTLYFVSDRKGGYGGKDIWFSERLANGGWSIPQNMGPHINTPLNEESPFLSLDGTTLYFSSEGHESIGGYDIFKSVKIGNGWSEAENIGYPLNSLFNEMSFFISADNTHGYFSSDRFGGFGKQDIYRVDFIHDKKPMTILKGIVFDADTYKPISAKIQIEESKSGDIVALINNNSENGEYFITLEPDKNYKMIVTTDNYKSFVDKLETDSEKQINKAVLLKKFDKGNKKN